MTTAPLTNRVARKRNRQSAKAAGSRQERQIADYLKQHVSPYIDRKVKTGALDQGDIANVFAFQQPVAVEVKNEATLKVGPWLGEAETERVNLSAVAGVVIAKRHGIGHPGKQVVLMTVDDLIALLTGLRPQDD